MKSYRITKYDPVYRENTGGYTKNEWTSFADIGDSFDGEVLTEMEYQKVETRYLDVIKSVFAESQQKEVVIIHLDNYKKLPWKNKQKINLLEVETFSRDCLREQCWGKLKGRRFFVHFGYDYYMYIGTDLPKEKVEKIARDNNLFCEEFSSPYND